MHLKRWWTATLLLRCSLSATRQFHQGTLYVIPNSFKPFSMLSFGPQPKCVRYCETIMSMQTTLTCKYCNSYSSLCNGWINVYLITAVHNSLCLPALMCFHFIADIFPKTRCPMLQCTRMHSEIWPAWLHCKMMENIGCDICSAESPVTQLLIFAMRSNIYWPVG